MRNCPAYGKQCEICSRYNHFAKVCNYRTDILVNRVDEESSDDSFYIDSLTINEIHENKIIIRSDSWKENIMVENSVIKFKIDTGSDINVIPK